MTKLNKIVCAAVLLVAVAVIGGCAKQGYPEGGPKDTKPPVLLRVTPPSGCTNFTATEFYMEFDEYVNIKDADNNVIISPPMQPKPTYRNKGKGILVTINDTLSPETTYLLQFKQAIADFNEGNLLQSLHYAFSTGSAIDTMSVAGTVFDASTHKAREKSVTVMLFSELGDDSVIMRGRPDYLTRCDKNGDFLFSNIRDGVYRIIALEDADKDMRYGDNEAIAFLDSNVVAGVVGKNGLPAVSYKLRMSFEQRLVQRVLKSEMAELGKATIVTSAPMRNPYIVCDTPAVWSVNLTKDTIRFWTFNRNATSMNVMLRDSSGIDDTVKLAWRPTRANRTARSKAGEAKKEAWAKWANKDKTPYYDPLRLVFTMPIDTTKLHGDSTVVVVHTDDSSVTYHRLVVDPSLLSASVDLKVEAGEPLSLCILPNTIYNMFGEGTDSLKLKTQIIGADQYGGIFITLKPKGEVAPLYVVQLTDEAGKVIRSRTIVGGEQAVFDYLTPATYKIQAFADRNGNGLWDPGRYWQHLQPEEIYYLDKKIILRANWDIEETFEF